MPITHVTKHARKRIENDNRTNLSVDEVIELIRQPHALRVGQVHYVYSHEDQKTLKVITGKQGRTLITVYDTAREPTRIGDMVGRALAGESVPFRDIPAPTSFGEDHASSLTLGTFKLRKRRNGSTSFDITELYDAGSVYGVFKHVEGSLESHFIHEMVVEAATHALAEGKLSKEQIKRLTFFVDDRVNRQIGYLPVWISFALLGLEYEGGMFIPRP